MIKLLLNKKFLPLILTGAIGIVSSLFFYDKIDYLWMIALGVFSLIVLPYLLSNVTRLLYVTFFTSPISVDVLLSGGFKLSTPSEFLVLMSFGIISIKLIVGMKFRKNIIFHPLSLLILLFLFSTIVSTALSQDKLIASKRMISLLIFVGVFYFFTLQILTAKKELRKLYFLYGIGMIIPIISATFNHSIWNFRQEASVYTPLPFYDEHTIYGACIAFILPYFVLNTPDKKNPLRVNFFHLFMSILLSIGLILSYSRAAWLSVIAAFVFYLLIKIRVKFSHFMMLLLLAVGIIYINFNSMYGSLRENSLKYGQNVGTHLVSVTNLRDDASNKERINRWVCAMRMFEEKPWFGFGPGTYQFNYGKYQTNEFTTRISTHSGDKGNAHSEYLTFLSETGIFGFTLFMAILLYSIYLSLKLLRKNIDQQTKILVYSAILGLFTFYIHGLFNSFSDAEKMAVLFFPSLAILTSIDLKQTRQLNFW